MTLQNHSISSALEENRARPLFFSGGTALGSIASALAEHTPHAVHVVTTFDSGGSSAILREAFSMPAVGDVRARLAALADASAEGCATLVELFTARLPGTPRPRLNGTDEKAPFSACLKDSLKALGNGEHPHVGKLPGHMAEWFCGRIRRFLEEMPPDLNLCGASLGNLVLTAEYLASGRSLRTATEKAARILKTRGVVMPVAEQEAHLCVRLQSGERIIGQHCFTGKSAGRITSPIADIWLSASLDNAAPIQVDISPELTALIRHADLVCYPVGSFFSSVLANLLPRGVREAVREARCPKMFIPNLGTDPELLGLTVRDQVRFLLRHLLPAPLFPPRDPREDIPDYLSCLLIDIDERRYAGGIPHAWLKSLGIHLVRVPLVTPASKPYLDPDLVCRQVLDACKP